MSLHGFFFSDLEKARLYGPPVRVEIEARIVLTGAGEHVCCIREASAGEMAVEAPLEPEYGARVILYSREFGRLEGVVARETEGGFVISLDLSDARRRRLAAQLTWMANRDSVRLADVRRHIRFVPKMPWTSVRMPDGRERFAQINDVSRGGVSVDADASKVAVGDRVAFGVKAAVVGRVFEGGFVAEFEEPFAEGELSESLRI